LTFESGGGCGAKRAHLVSTIATAGGPPRSVTPGGDPTYNDFANCVEATHNYAQIRRCQTVGRRLIRWANCSADELKNVAIESKCGEMPDIASVELSFG